MAVCDHDKNIEFSPKEVSKIFQKSYVTILKWLGDCDSKGRYTKGSFVNAYKCRNCKKIYIPVADVEAKMEEYRRKMKEV